MSSKIDPAVEKATEEVRGKFAALRKESGKAIVGHGDVVDGVLTALLVGGHVLLEGVPGLLDKMGPEPESLPTDPAEVAAMVEAACGLVIVER